MREYNLARAGERSACCFNGQDCSLGGGGGRGVCAICAVISAQSVCAVSACNAVRTVCAVLAILREYNLARAGKRSACCFNGQDCSLGGGGGRGVCAICAVISAQSVCAVSACNAVRTVCTVLAVLREHKLARVGKRSVSCFNGQDCSLGGGGGRGVCAVNSAHAICAVSACNAVRTICTVLAVLREHKLAWVGKRSMCCFNRQYCSLGGGGGCGDCAVNTYCAV